MVSLDLIDRKILNIIQLRFPLSIEPYKEIAEELDLTTDEVLARVTELKKNGIIRRIGAVLDAGALGYCSTLCCCKLPENNIEEFSKVVNEIKFITHNYIRDHEYNIWFTLTTPSLEVQGQIIHMLEDSFNIKIYNMPAEKVFKIKFALGM